MEHQSKYNQTMVLISEIMQQQIGLLREGYSGCGIDCPTHGVQDWWDALMAY